MKGNLFQVCKEYADVIEQIENTTDPDKLHSLEERRVELHLKVMDMFKRQGIKFKDRDHATRIALRIAKGEL